MRRSADLRGERGFTLLELNVAMALGIVLLLGMFAVLEATLRQSATIGDRTAATQSGRVLMEAMQRDLRDQVCITPTQPTAQNPALTPLVSASGNSVTFYSALYGQNGAGTSAFAPGQYTLTYDPAALTVTETIRAGSGTYPNVTFPAVTSTRVLGTRVKLDLGVPFFAYYANDTDGTVSSTPLPTPLSAGDLGRVVQMGVHFVSAPPGDAQGSAVGTTIDDTVSIRLPTDSGTNGPSCVV